MDCGRAIASRGDCGGIVERRVESKSVFVLISLTFLWYFAQTNQRTNQN